MLAEHPHLVSNWYMEVRRSYTEAVIIIDIGATVEQRAQLSSTLWDATDRGYWQTGRDPKNTKDRFRWGLVLKKETQTK